MTQPEATLAVRRVRRAVAPLAFLLAFLLLCPRDARAADAMRSGGEHEGSQRPVVEGANQRTFLQSSLAHDMYYKAEVYSTIRDATETRPWDRA